MTTIDKDIAEAIDKNLPAMVGDKLRERLALVDELEATIVKHEEIAKHTLAMLNARDNTIADLQRRAKFDSELDVREKEVAAREAKTALLELQLKLETERRQEIKGLVELVFRSPTFERRVSGMVPVPIEGNPGGNGCYSSPGSVLQSSVDVTERVTRA